VSQACKDADAAGSVFDVCIQNVCSGDGAKWYPFTKEHVAGGIPVLIVKTATDISPIADTRVVENNPNTNYSTGTAFITNNNPYEESRKQSYLKFALNSLGTNTIASAKLMDYCNVFGDGTVDSIRTTAHSVDDESWSDANLTWSTMPYSADTLAPISVGSLTGVGWLSLDVTSAIVAQLAGNDTASFILYNPDISSTNAQMQFASMENTANNGLNKPYLRVIYNTDRAPAMDASCRSGTNSGTN
jgi:hypothetical protein